MSFTFFLGGDGGIMTLGLALILESTMANMLFNILVAMSNPHAFGPSLSKIIIDIEIDEIGFENSIVKPSKKRKAKWQVQRNF